MKNEISRREFLRQMAIGAVGGSMMLNSLACAPTRPAAPRSSSTDLPNIILIGIDALTSRHMSCYGYERETTPNIDALIAGQGVRFSNAVTAVPWCLPAVASLLSGYHPFSINSTFANRDFPRQVPRLAERLRAAGYHTEGCMSAYPLGSNHNFDQGFAHYDDKLPRHNGRDERLGIEVNETVMNRLDKLDAAQPFFLFMYYFDPHSWYNPPPPYDTLYDPDYAGALTPESFQDGEKVMGGAEYPSDRDIEHLIALYDGETAYTDYCIGEMLRAFAARGWLDNSIVVLVADHGEMFGEHGCWLHGYCLYEEVLQVPLIIRYPAKINAGQVIDTRVLSMDLVPTLLALAGLDVPADLDAQNLAPLIAGAAPDATREIVSAVDSNPRWVEWFGEAYAAEHWSIHREGWKYITNSRGETELYYLPEDPRETRNLITAEVERAAQLSAALAAWRAVHDRRS